MSNIVNLPTHEQIVQLMQELGIVNANVDSVKAIANIISTNTATANLGPPTSAASNAAGAVAHAKLNYLLNSLAGGFIKSIQKGIVEASGNDGTTRYTISINNVNPSKCVVLINGMTSIASGMPSVPFLEDINAQSIIIGSNTWRLYNKVSWQVLEFY